MFLCAAHNAACLPACLLARSLTHLQALHRGHAAGGWRVKEQGDQVGHPVCGRTGCKKWQGREARD
jgi:hypothetical protein